MYKWRLPDYDVTITLDAEEVDEPATLKVRGKEPLLGFVHDELKGASGMFGHSFEYEGATPVDTQHALVTSFDNIEWFQEEIENYEPDLAEGAVT